MKIKLTRERAFELHRQMWTDMRKDLGDNPGRIDRIYYKRNWIESHFPEYENIRNNCFLCEYAGFNYGYCECLIEWPCGRCEDADEEYDMRNWQYMPISKLLALPVKGEEE